MSSTNRPRLSQLAAAVVLVVACGRVEPDTANSPQHAPAISLQPADEQAIERRLATIYTQVDGLDDVSIDASAGVVVLEGTTHTRALEEQAVAIANRLDGVVFVKSEIRQPSDAPTLLGRSLADLGRSVRDAWPRLVTALLVFAPFVLLSLVLRWWRHPFHRLGASRLTGNLLRRISRAGLIFVGIVIALHVVGVTGLVVAVFGTLGILGVGVGFALKDWASNFFPALRVGLHPPFRTGDLIQLGTHEGRVVRITPHALVLITTNGEEVRIPSAELARQTLINFSHNRERRLRFVMPVSPRADLRVVDELGRRALLGVRGVLAEPPPFMRLHALGRDWIEIELLAWVDQHAVTFRNAESDAKRAVFEALAHGGVPLPDHEVAIRIAGSEAVNVRAEAQSVGDDSHALDDAFLAGQLSRARAEVGERDLLDEGTAPVERVRDPSIRAQERTAET